MGQEFIIKSQGLEDKINQLLPSQGGFAAGVDLSASTTVIPIVDLTETAEGSNLRQDLQSSFGINTETYAIFGTNSTILNTTGYFRLFGSYTTVTNATTNLSGNIQITDGTTTKAIFRGSASNQNNLPYDFIIFLKAGESCEIACDTNARIIGVARQIADINGNLVNP